MYYIVIYIFHLSVWHMLYLLQFNYKNNVYLFYSFGNLKTHSQKSKLKLQVTKPSTQTSWPVPLKVMVTFWCTTEVRQDSESSIKATSEF